MSRASFWTGRHIVSSRHGSDLDTQALRLTPYARDQLAALALRLSAGGPPVKAAEAARGLCVLTLELARGAAGNDAADAVRIAASDPAPDSVLNALVALVTLLDFVPSTTPVLDDRAVDARSPTGHRRALNNQALRLPKPARCALEALTVELRAAGARVSAAGVIRGLCLLALEIAGGGAGAELSAAFCIAARNPTADGQHQAIEALQRLFDVAPSTTRDPSPPTTRSGDSLPPTSKSAA
jgi:hypothetical protein